MADLTLKRNDTRPTLTIVLQEGSPPTPINLTNATSARLILKPTSGATVIVTLAFGTRAAGEVIATFIGADTDVSGVYNGEVEITWTGGGIETVPNTGYFTVEIKDDLA